MNKKKEGKFIGKMKFVECLLHNNNGKESSHIYL